MSGDKESNVMRKIKIEKLVINCSVGGSTNDAVNKAAKVLSVCPFLTLLGPFRREEEAYSLQVQVHYQILRSQKRRQDRRPYHP